MPTLWTEQVPATITHSELGRSLGLGAGAGANSRLMNSPDRVVPYGLGAWHEQDRSLDVYLRAPGLSQHLERLPEWTRRAHERLPDAHVHRLAEPEDAGPKVAALTARLDRLQRPRAVEPAALPVRSRAGGR
jgi:hypothetical protein